MVPVDTKFLRHKGGAGLEKCLSRVRVANVHGDIFKLRGQAIDHVCDKGFLRNWCFNISE